MKIRDLPVIIEIQIPKVIWEVGKEDKIIKNHWLGTGQGAKDVVKSQVLMGKYEKN